VFRLKIGSIVNIFSISRFCHVGELLIAITICGLLTQFAYAAEQVMPPDKSATVTNPRSNAIQNASSLLSTNKGSLSSDCAVICIFCHIPHGSNHTIEDLKWTRNTKVVPSRIPTTN